MKQRLEMPYQGTYVHTNIEQGIEMTYKGIIGQYKHETETGNALPRYICPHEHRTGDRNDL